MKNYSIVWKTLSVLSFIGSVGFIFKGSISGVVANFVIFVVSTLLLERSKKYDVHANLMAQNPCQGKLKLSLPSGKSEEDRFLAERFKKAIDDFNTIQEIEKKIKDPAILAQLVKMQGVAYNILQYLQKYPQKIKLAQRYIDYYQDKAVFISQKYLELEKMAVDLPEVQRMKERMKNTLQSFDEAYMEQLKKIMSDQFMDMEAELQVVDDILRTDGIDTKKARTEKSAQQNAKIAPDFDKTAPFPQTDVLRTAPLPSNHINHPQFEQQGIDCLEKELAHSQYQQNGSVYASIQRVDGERKNKWLAAALAIVGGSFGVHKFYLHKTAQGVFYILLSWTSLPGIIGIIEGLRYMFMSTEEFDRAYNQPRR